MCRVRVFCSQKNGFPFGDWSSFCQSLCFSFWLTLGFTIGRGDVHPTWRCTSPVRHRALWVGTTTLATVTTLPFSKEEGLFISPFVYFWWRKLFSFCKGMFFVLFLGHDPPSTNWGVCFFWEHAWINRWRKQRHSGHRPTPPGGVFLSVSRSLGWGGRRWRLSAVLASLKTVLCLVPSLFFQEEQIVSPCFEHDVFGYLKTDEHAGNKGRGPPLVAMTYARWGTPKGASRGKYWQINCKTTFLPLGSRVLLVSKRTVFFFGERV